MKLQAMTSHTLKSNNKLGCSQLGLVHVNKPLSFRHVVEAYLAICTNPHVTLYPTKDIFCAPVCVQLPNCILENGLASGDVFLENFSEATHCSDLMGPWIILIE